jgi:glycosyltransferase involved in cell wall biosynthesis
MTRLLFLVTEDWYFCSHRLPMARAARDAGFQVTVATRIDAHRAAIEAEGFRVVPLTWHRRSINPLAAVTAVAEIAALYRRERPHIVHHVALKPTVLGGLAAFLAEVPAVVNALTGLGTAFLGSGLKARLAGAVARPLLRFVLRRPGSVLVVQNEDDHQLLTSLGLVPAGRVHLIRGSGVDTQRFAELPEPSEPPVVVAQVGRLLDDKGVRTLVAAHGAVRARGVDMTLLLAGTPDPANPSSIPAAELAGWRALPGVELADHVTDVRDVWARAHVAVLASRREGLPKSLLEAAACGRAIIATDVPGCREVARAGVNALLVPPDDVAALAAALERLARDLALRRRLAAASRPLVLSDMAEATVGARIVDLYRSLLAEVGLAETGVGAVMQPAGPDRETPP